MGLSSNSIIHFTKTLSSLKGILTETFKVKYCRESIYSKSTSRDILVPMVSFCDIPFSQILKHVDNYGSYGVGFKKTWAENKGLNPVLYIDKNSALADNFFTHLFGKLTEKAKTQSDLNAQEKYILDIVRYMKNLHPTMSKQFLEVIENVFVKEKGVRVIITTHSPSTVALAKEEDLFVVNKTGVRIEKTTKDKALKILTLGVPSFSVNYENRRQVFVESANDVAYFEKIYQILSIHLIPEISLTFISSGESRTDKNGTKISNCDQVVNITDTLRNAGNNFVWGIIDYDDKNKSSTHIKVLGGGKRYSIENYLFDPILVAGLLLREKYIKREDLGLTNKETYIDFKMLAQEQLQGIANFVINKVESIVKPKEIVLSEVLLLNGVEVQIPTWYLNHHGHTLEEALLKVFPELNALKKGKEEALKIEIINKVIDDIPELLSKDMLDILLDVQAN